MKEVTFQFGRWMGSIWATLISLAITLIWLALGPVYHYSDGWQMFMSSLSSAITFVMVFLLQRSQNKDSLAMQIKLNEIIASLHGANNHIINIEELSENEIHSLHKSYQELATRIHESDEVSIDAVSTEEVVQIGKLTEV